MNICEGDVVGGAARVVERLRQAVDDHDLDALVGCFAADYRNETPAHPRRGFEGHAQVRANWQRIFTAIPDVSARVLRTALDGDVVWSEWELGGHLADGTARTLRGVIIFGTAGDRLVWARFYLEPVDAGDDGVDVAVTSLTGGERPTAAVARDVRPSERLVGVMNPVMRAVLRTPFGRLVRPFALLEFRGRRSGRLLRVPVGWHAADDGYVVVTPAAWRANFRGGAPVTVRFRGRRRELIGTVDDDPEAVATTLRSIAERRGSLRAVGIDVPDGHRIIYADVAAVDRVVIRFQPASA